MGLFGKSKKKEQTATPKLQQGSHAYSQENPFVEQLQAIGQELRDSYSQLTGVKVELTTEMVRQVMCVYLFGMGNGLLQTDNTDRTPLQFQTDMTTVLVTGFGYSALQAQIFVEEMIHDLKSGDKENSIYAIIHAGLDAYTPYSEGKKDIPAKAVVEIMKAIEQG